jgi:hypothetical protein
MRRKVFKKAFGAELLRDVYAMTEPAQGDPGELASKAQAAWEAHDRPAFVAAARGLQRRGEMDPRIALRLAQCLHDAGLYEAALEVLAGRPGEQELAAQARLALGEADPEPVPPSWAEASTLIWRRLEHGLAEPAVRTLSAWIGRADETEVIEAAVAILRLARPRTARALLDAMAPMLEQADDGARLDLRTVLAQARAAAGDWAGAITLFEPTRKRQDVTSENLCELARCVGQDVLSGLELRLRPPGPPKVFNLFPFNGEFTLLELRLEEMAPFVDCFVIVESAFTHTGRSKPLFFLERKDDFARWADKIVHVRAPDFPAHVGSPWARDFYQRDSAVAGLSGRASPEDLVIISDADEILRADALGRLPASPLVGADLRTFSYFFNYEVIYERPRIKAAIARAGLLTRNGSSYLRVGAPRYLGHTFVEKAGWHFTSIAEPAGLARKFQDTSHVEWGHLDKDYFEALWRKIRTEGLGPHYARRELDEGFPAAIRRRRSELAGLLL